MNQKIAFTLLLLLAACGKKHGKAGEAETALARHVSLKDVVSQTGVVEPVVKATLKSEAGGKVDSIYAKEGSRLKKGETILVIDPTRLKNSKKSLDLEIREQSVLLNQAKRNLDNGAALFEKGAIPKKQYEDLQNEFELKSISVEKLKLQLEDVNYQLNRTVITSPMAGVLISLLVEKGEIVSSATSGFSGGTELGTVADISSLEIAAQIGEVDYPKLHEGQSVDVSLDADDNRKTTGKIYFLSLSAKKEANSEISNFEVRIAIDSLIPGLLPGLNVNVDFVLMEKKEVLGVPYAFVYNSERGKGGWGGGGGQHGQGAGPGGHGGWGGGRGGKGGGGGGERETGKYVLLFPDGAHRPVKTGETDFHHWEILSGLSEGDKVMLEPEDEKKDSKNQGPRGNRR